MAAVLLLFGLASSLRGMWVRTFAGVPQFEVVLEQAQDEEFDDDAVRWASAASLDAAVRYNDELIHQKAAAVRVTCSAVLAAALLLSLFVLFLVGSPPGSDGGGGGGGPPPLSSRRGGGGGGLGEDPDPIEQLPDGVTSEAPSRTAAEEGEEASAG